MLPFKFLPLASVRRLTLTSRTVVIDEAVAFVGGIDLAYGRYEDMEYSIVDPNEAKFPGRDYCNFNHLPETNGPASIPVIDRQKLARMPWQDVHMQVIGAPASGALTVYDH
jgi:phospholipase D1/2